MSDPRIDFIHRCLDADEWTAKAKVSADPVSVLEDIAAKRAILELHEPYASESNGGPTCWTCGPGGFPFPCTTLRTLASAYRSRPGWDDSWGPT